MSTTLTIARDRIADLRPGDVITHVDNVPLHRPHTVAEPFDAAHNRLPLVNRGGATRLYLYPDTHVSATLTVEREEPKPPAPKKPRKPVTRTFDGLRLVSQGNGRWLTEDGRYEIRKGFDGYTMCDGPHPVRLTSGLYCEGGEVHENPESWQLWDLRIGDYVTEPRHDSFKDAADDLARHLRTRVQP